MIQKIDYSLMDHSTCRILLCRIPSKFSKSMLCHLTWEKKQVNIIIVLNKKNYM